MFEKVWVSVHSEFDDAMIIMYTRWCWTLRFTQYLFQFTTDVLYAKRAIITLILLLLLLVTGGRYRDESIAEHIDMNKYNSHSCAPLNFIETFSFSFYWTDCESLQTCFVVVDMKWQLKSRLRMYTQKSNSVHYGTVYILTQSTFSNIAISSFICNRTY